MLFSLAGLARWSAIALVMKLLRTSVSEEATLLSGSIPHREPSSILLWMQRLRRRNSS